MPETLISGWEEDFAAILAHDSGAPDDWVERFEPALDLTVGGRCKVYDPEMGDSYGATVVRFIDGVPQLRLDWGITVVALRDDQMEDPLAFDHEFLSVDLIRPANYGEYN